MKVTTTDLTLRSSLLLLFVVTLVAQGCDLLQTRDPEDPEVPGGTFNQPTDPYIVLANLRSAVEEKNAANYVRCLSDETSGNRTFQFQPTQSALSRFQSEFSDWTVTSEQQYFSNLATSTPGGVSLLDFFEQSMNPSVDSAVFSAKYRLIFQHNENTLEEEARGRVDYYLGRNEIRGDWSIYRWIDYPDTSQTTWSDFKGTFIR